MAKKFREARKAATHSAAITRPSAAGGARSPTVSLTGRPSRVVPCEAGTDAQRAPRRPRGARRGRGAARSLPASRPVRPRTRPSAGRRCPRRPRGRARGTPGRGPGRRRPSREPAWPAPTRAPGPVGPEVGALLPEQLARLLTGLRSQEERGGGADQGAHGQEAQRSQEVQVIAILSHGSLLAAIARAGGGRTRQSPSEGPGRHRPRGPRSRSSRARRSSSSPGPGRHAP